MRNPLFFAIIILVVNTTLFAQKTATWKGGTPGKPNDWNCSANWREGRVPNEFSDVVIPNLENRNYPLINRNVDDINTLLVMSEASLTIGKKGSLSVFEKLEIAQGGSICNNGKLNLPISEIPISKNQNTVELAKRVDISMITTCQNEH